MRVRSQQIQCGELLTKIDQIIKKLRLNVSSPVAILRAILIEAYPAEYNQLQRVSIFTTTHQAMEYEFVKKFMWQCFNKNKSKSDLLADVIQLINSNVETIVQFSKLRLLLAAYFSIFQRYRRYLNDSANEVLLCVDFWMRPHEAYIADVIEELNNPSFLSENINQLRRVTRSQLMLQTESGRLTTMLNALVVLTVEYRGDVLDDFICEIRTKFSAEQRATIAMNLWNRCGLHNYDSTEKSLQALLVFYDDIEIRLMNGIRERLNNYIFSAEYPASLKAHAVKFLYASLKSLSDQDRVASANRCLRLMLHPEEVVRIQAMHSFVECGLYITEAMLREIVQGLFGKLRTNLPFNHAGVVEIITTLYGYANYSKQDEILDEMCKLILERGVNDVVKLDAYRFFVLLFNVIEHKRKIQIIRSTIHMFETSDYTNTRIPAAFLNQYHSFMKANYLHFDVNIDLDGVEFSAERGFLQRILTMAELSRFVDEDRRKLFCDAVFDQLVATTDLRVIFALEQAFDTIVPMLSRVQYISYMQRLILAACNAANDPRLDAEVQSAYQSRYLTFFIHCLKLNKISIDADSICDQLIFIIRNSNDNVERILDGIEVLSSLLHNPKTKIKMLKLLFELIRHQNVEVRKNAMEYLNTDFSSSHSFFSGAINTFIKKIDRIINKNHLDKITYLSEILLSLRNVISSENFNSIVYFILNKMDISDEWNNLKHEDRNRVYAALEMNLDKMDHHMLIMLLSRLRRIISDKMSMQHARGLFFSAYEALQQNLTADLLVGYANQKDMMAPDEVIGMILSFNRH